MVKKNSLSYDAILLLILFLVGLGLFRIFNFDCNFTFNSVGGILVSLFGTLLGFIITAFTILFMFDNDNNVILKKIKKAGLFSQIHERFITTIGITFIALIYSLIYLFIAGRYSDILIFNLILIYLSFLVLLRVYRSLRVLYMIYQTIE